MTDTIPLTITQASLNQTALDFPRNITNIMAAIDEAAARGSDILALEEMTITGYEVNDDFQRTDNAVILNHLNAIAAYAQQKAPNLIISVGHPWRLQQRDLPVMATLGPEAIKHPLYDPLHLPFNVQTLIGGGKILGMTAKTNLYNDQRGYERRYFSEWDVAAIDAMGGTYGTIDIPIAGHGMVPFGRPIIGVRDQEGQREFILTQAICHEKWIATSYDGHPYDDSRYADHNIIPTIPQYLGTKDGVVLLIANASPPSRDKMDKHVHLDTLASRYADLVVDTDGLGTSGSTFAQFGHRMIIQDGKVICYGPRMQFSRVASTTSEVTVTSSPHDAVAKAHRRLDHVFNTVSMNAGPNLTYLQNAADAWDSPENPDRHFEESIRYSAFWLFDYMRKIGSTGIAEALSGGADSAFNTLLFAVMAHVAIKQLGATGFCREFNLPKSATDQIIQAEQQSGHDAAVQMFLKTYLTAVYMGTNNSSDQTRFAAEFLMNGGIDPVTLENVPGIGGTYLYRNVQGMLDMYAVHYAVEDIQGIEEGHRGKFFSDIAQYFNSSIHTTTHEHRQEMAKELCAKYSCIIPDRLINAADNTVAYENIQARARQVLIMEIANAEGKIAIANPNLDEARNAYATFGGDLHSGTINLNAHLPKQYELAVIRYLYMHGLKGVLQPVRALGPILRNTPTAELQPKNAKGEVVQFDEKALQRNFGQMDYISRTMLHTHIMTPDGERRLNAAEIYKNCQSHSLFAGVDANLLYNMICVSYRQWAVAQHKIHASPIAPTYGENVDHQTSQRTPNLSGQSRDELTLLGLDILFSWAERDGITWPPATRDVLYKRAQWDESFIRKFGANIRSTSSAKERQDYDIEALYRKIQAQGWDGIFAPLPTDHFINVISQMKPTYE